MNNQTIAFGVYYVPNKSGKVFAGLKSELNEVFSNQIDAIKFCDHMNIGGPLDELHIGFRVYPMLWIPKNFTIKQTTL